MSGTSLTRVLWNGGFYCDAISTFQQAKLSAEFVQLCTPDTLTIFRRRAESFESASATRASKKYSERDHIVVERVSITGLVIMSK